MKKDDPSYFMPKGKMKHSGRLEYYFQQFRYPYKSQYFQCALNFGMSTGTNINIYEGWNVHESVTRYGGIFFDIQLFGFRACVHLRPFRLKDEQGADEDDEFDPSSFEGMKETKIAKGKIKL